MKRFVSLFILSLFFLIPSFGQKYLSEIIAKESDLRIPDGFTTISCSYWRFDTCLYSKQICKYNSATGVRVRIIKKNNCLKCELKFTSHNRLNGEYADNEFNYFFYPRMIDSSLLVRTLILERKKGNGFEPYSRIDTFKLNFIDTLVYKNYNILRKVFGKVETGAQRDVKIYVLKSVDSFGSIMLHFWVERIGIVKLTDEKCWRYSFEIDDSRTKAIKKMFVELSQIIKRKYKDPYWLSQPCSVE